VIRRTLINRARRQRDLARTLIARHSLMAHDRGQPQLHYRPAAHDAAVAFASSAELAAPMVDLSTPYMDALGVPSPAGSELPTDLETVVQIALAERSADHPAAGMEAFSAPLATWAEASLVERAPQASDIHHNAPHTVDPDRSAAPASEITMNPEPAQAAPDVAPKPAGNTLADLIRRMRAPDWIPPEPAASTKPAPPAAGSITNEQIADVARSTQPPSQSSPPRVERRRIPLGQRMSEASDFGQTPTTARHLDPAAPAHAEQSIEAASNLPAPAVFETEYPAAERSDSAVADLPAPAGMIDPAGQPPIVAGTDTEAVARASTVEAPQPATAAPDAPMPNPSAPLDKAAPPTAPRVMNQAAQIDIKPRMAAALSSSHAPATEIAEHLPNRDALMASPVLAISDLRAPTDIPTAVMHQIERPAADAAQVDQVDAARRPATPAPDELRQPIKPAIAEAARADAAPAITPAVPQRPVVAKPTSQSYPTSPSLGQASPEAHDSYRAMADLPPQLAENAPAQVAAEPAVAQSHTRAGASPSAKSELQQFLSEANTHVVPIQAPASPLPDTAGIRSALIESASENQPVSFRAPESSAPQVQSPQIFAPSATPTAFPDAPISSARMEPVVDSQPLGGAQVPGVERAGAAASTTPAPERISPQAWAAPSSLPERVIPAPNTHTARPVSAPNAGQQLVSNAGVRAKKQPDVILAVAESSAHLPIAERELSISPHDQIRALNPQAADVAAPIAPTAAALDEPMPALDQARQARPSNAALAGIDMALPDRRIPVAQAAETSVARSSDLESQPVAITAATDLGVMPDVTQHLAAIEVLSEEPVAGNSAAGAEHIIPSTQMDNGRNLREARYQLPVQEANSASEITAEHAPAATTAVPIDHGFALPSLAQRSSGIYDVPAVAPAMPAADPAAPGSPQAWAARFARHRAMTELQPDPAATRALVTPISQPTTATVDVGTKSTSTAAPGSPQAWAARFARHRAMTEPQPDPAVTRTPAAPDRSATMIADPALDASARVVPARRVSASVASAVDMHAAATRRSPIVQDAATPVDDVPSTAAPEPGSPQAWAARFARHRAMTEPQAELISAPVPTLLSNPSIAQTAPAVDMGAESIIAPGSPQAWAVRFVRHRQLTEPQAEKRGMDVPEVHLNKPTLPPAAPQRTLDQQPQSALRQAVPTPMAETMRRFLRPLVGIDPAEVRVFRGPAAAKITDAYRAEALASGDMVALAAQHGEDSPATLGVLAHELTHIARQRDARFVPPLVRRENMAGAANEEALAQSVEAQVRQIARSQDSATRRMPGPLDTTLGRDTPFSALAATPMEHRPTAHTPQLITRGDDWGGLPAPWEPLPQWLDAQQPAEMPPPAISAPTRSAPPAQPFAPQPGAPSAPVQLAETGRMLDAPPAQSTPAPAPAPQPAPDLDALARQVYAVLKQRLAAERRRSQS
jgi:hypothetical protein